MGIVNRACIAYALAALFTAVPSESRAEAAGKAKATPQQKQTAERITIGKVKELLETTRNFNDMDLSGLELSGLDLSNASFRRAKLRNVKLRKANLRGSQFYFADMRNADLTGADVSGAKFCPSDLRKASMRNAVMVGTEFLKADLSGADLSGADMQGANVYHTIFTGVKFDGTKNLDTLTNRETAKGLP